MRGLQKDKDVGLMLNAITFEASKHRNWRRKDAGASPYVNHPIDLVEVLWHEGGVRDQVIIAAALLHDTIEDTETRPEELRGAFGASVAVVVEAVTDVKWLSKRSRKELQARVHRGRRRAPSKPSLPISYAT